MRRCYSINELLICLMSARIKIECRKMVEAGADIQQINEALPDMVTYYDTWREEMLSRCMREFDDLERPRPPDDGTSLRPN